MQKLPFFKYQGAGNDFVVVDQRRQRYLGRNATDQIRWLCDRRFGIGADGLMLLEPRDGYDFEMVYFNADGREGSMCGNGGRCIVAFARELGLIDTACLFWAIDGEHEAKITKPDWVELKMQNVQDVEQGDHFYLLDTGSPHYVRFVPDIEAVDVVQEGRSVRYSERFREAGVNVNFVKAGANQLEIATYERGVEDETLACGTGVTAAALAHYLQTGGKGPTSIPVKAKGGDLEVRFQATTEGFTEVWLCGPAQKVFKGNIELIIH